MGLDCRVGKANGSRECAPDDKLRVPTIFSYDVKSGGHGAKSAFAHPTMLFACEKRDQQNAPSCKNDWELR
jgi:hypothetical protein